MKGLQKVTLLNLVTLGNGFPKLPKNANKYYLYIINHSGSHVVFG